MIIRVVEELRMIHTYGLCSTDKKDKKATNPAHYVEQRLRFKDLRDMVHLEQDNQLVGM